VRGEKEAATEFKIYSGDRKNSFSKLNYAYVAEE
jgi:hypothetical protein